MYSEILIISYNSQLCSSGKAQQVLPTLVRVVKVKLKEGKPVKLKL
jgi:hypothetical protein